MTEPYFEFIQQHDNTRVSVKIDGHSNLAKLTEAFEQFVKASGFYVVGKLDWDCDGEVK